MARRGRGIRRAAAPPPPPVAATQRDVASQPRANAVAGAARELSADGDSEPISFTAMQYDASAGEDAPAMAQSSMPQEPVPADNSYSLMEVAKHLDISPEMLRTWNRRFAPLLGATVAGETPRYAGADVAVLRTVQALLDDGYSDAEVQKSLTPRRIEPERPPASLPSLAQMTDDAAVANSQTHALAVPSMLGDVLGAIAGSQQTVLNSQASMREMVSVVVQDNFNLKDENRKLRDRMLELERGLAEYQRREETRKERIEARMRALEGTVSALQQQMSQFVQMQRAAQTKRRGWW